MSAWDSQTALSLLETGSLDIVGLVPWGSNYTFLVDICSDTHEAQAIYKPRRGERPLWDFDQGTLCLRERGAFVVSEALGWGLVPPTVMRDGPHGLGSVQLFIDHDPDENYFTFEGRFGDQLRRVALFDIIVNNADRKGGHLLRDSDDRLWAIDNGLSFNSDYKLRSVVWDFAGEPIDAANLADVQQFSDRLSRDAGLIQTLETLLSASEYSALRRRTSKLVTQAIFPHPGPGRHYPWPPV